ncbi:MULTISPECIES: alpha/beta hydrolase [Bacillus]|uniref:Alpha/beta fold hydrolase n=2 Tax=Bacillus mycoides TaxID=1405 RepID=A0ABX6ZDL1_BACMY|nr:MULTISPECIES: alpha/beta hydrolase [Bacillus cereus group]AJH20184.1 alpha/beta hydrolase family protein [Bacillus mycoides]EEL99309.1 Lipase [Bacillus mycoides DSM 2048]KUH43678.1 Lipase [Bacillus mycoides]MDR4238081.1 alpha/beta hydrolase [Bacillus mycoides]MED1023929.1 alpha/beta hydrolase [Bacillus mycoides]
MKRYYINNEKINAHITEWRNNEKSVIFCLHGLGSTSLSFIEIAEELKEEYRFISIDAPGHGKTPPFERTEDYEMLNLANWLNEIINELRIEHFYFLSHSWGSFVALFYLLNNPEKVLGSILIDGGYQTKRLQEETLEEEIAYYEKDFEEYIFNNWGGFFKSEKEAYTRWSPLLEVAVKDLGIEMDNKVCWHARGTTAGNIIRGMHKDETIDIYEKLPSNIILLRATVPQIWDEYRDKTVRIFKLKTGAKVKLISDTTHLLHWDKPEVVIEEIKSNWS